MQTSDVSAQQINTMAEKVSAIQVDVAVIKERTEPIRDHETRIRSLESTRSRLWAIWGGALVGGAVLGWLISYLTFMHK